MKKRKERNSALDIVRIVALLSVISVHFFLNNGYYSQIVAGKRMYVMTVMRTFFMICVPLFIILTGYLMNKKTLSKKYYFGITKTLGIYVLASISCMIFKSIFFKINYSFTDYITSILNFSGANYSWYIEMYIGLFMLIPFLNLIYNNLTEKKHKHLLILTLLFLTSLPSIINIYEFNINWFKTPSISSNYQKIMPSWWENIYPLCYYFIGAYLKEYKVKLNKIFNILLIFIIAIINGTFNFYRSYGSTFISGPYQNWGSILNVILTVLIFILISNININSKYIKTKNILAKISGLCLGGYLVSYIFDQYFYSKLNNAIPDMLNRLNYFIIIVPIVFTFSILLSYILNLIYNGLSYIFSRIIYLYNKKLIHNKSI